LNPSEKTLEALSKLSTEDALLLLEAHESKRQKEQYIKYWNPTERQLPLIRAWTAGIKIFGILGGNRSGKTEMGAAIAVAYALGKDFFKDEPAWEWVKDLPIPDKACNIWVVGLDYPTLRDVIWREKLRFGRNHPGLVPKDSLVKPPNDSDYQIFFKNGSVITGKSADSGREKFQGASVDLVWIDEEPEADVFDECYQRTVDCGGKILITLTPFTDIASGVRTPWVFDLHEDMRKGQKDVKFVQLSVLDNPYVPQEEKDKLMVKWAGHPEEKARLYGDFVQRSGLVYNVWDGRIGGHLVRPFVVPRDWGRIVSIDPAATGTTACLWAAVHPTTHDLYLYKEYYNGNLVVSEHAKSILVRNAGDPIDIWLIDPKWGSQRNNETHKTGMQLYRDSGIPVRLAEVGPDFGLQVSLEYVTASVTPASRNPKVFVFSDLTNFVNEITHYTWATFGKGEMKGLSKEKPLKRNDHLMNAFQYLCAMRPKMGAKTRYAENLTLEEQYALQQRNSYT
jgi:phage terminase large subunit-like protein